MEVTDFALYVPEAEDTQRPKMTAAFINSFDMAPIFLLKDEDDPQTVELPKGTMPVGVCSDPRFSEEDGSVRASIFIKNSLITEHEAFHIAGVELGVLDGEDKDAAVISCVVQAVYIKDGMNPEEEERLAGIAALKQELNETE